VPKFCREQLQSKERFDHRSFRTMRVGRRKDHRLLIGCPKGEWDPAAERCHVGMQPKTLMHPLDCDKARSCDPKRGRWEFKADTYLEGLEMKRRVRIVSGGPTIQLRPRGRRLEGLPNQEERFYRKATVVLIGGMMTINLIGLVMRTRRGS